MEKKKAERVGAPQMVVWRQDHDMAVGRRSRVPFGLLDAQPRRAQQLLLADVKGPSKENELKLIGTLFAKFVPFRNRTTIDYEPLWVSKISGKRCQHWPSSVISKKFYFKKIVTVGI